MSKKLRAFAQGIIEGKPAPKAAIEGLPLVGAHGRLFKAF
jgi:hypothetical protein